MLHGIGKILAILVFASLMLGININTRAQQTPTIITYEQTIEGSLDATDLTLQNGRHFDQYTFEAEAGRPYVVTIRSDTFAALGLLAFGDGTPLQMAYVFQPGAQVQFSGTLEQLGQYTIVVTTSGDASALGPYTLTLSEQTHGGQCVGGTFASPVMIVSGQTLTCTLTERDEQVTDDQGQVYFLKYFIYESDGAPVTINVQSPNFTPAIVGKDPTTGQPTLIPPSVPIPFPQGPALFLIYAQEPNTTGQFTVSVSREDGGSGNVTTGLLANTWVVPSADLSSGLLTTGWRYNLRPDGNGFAQQIQWEPTFGGWVPTAGLQQDIIAWEFSNGIVRISGPLLLEPREYPASTIEVREGNRIVIPTTDPALGGRTYFIQCLQDLCNDVPGPQAFQ